MILIFPFTRNSSLFCGQSSRNEWLGRNWCRITWKGITHIFSDASSIPLDIRDFKMKLVCCTPDDASVNFGTKTGLMTRLSVQRPWMIKIHFVNHRIELAIKEAIVETEFSKVNDFYYFALLVFYCTSHTIARLTVFACAFCHKRIERACTLVLAWHMLINSQGIVEVRIIKEWKVCTLEILSRYPWKLPWKNPYTLTSNYWID